MLSTILQHIAFLYPLKTSKKRKLSYILGVTEMEHAKEY